MKRTLVFVGLTGSSQKISLLPPYIEHTHIGSDCHLQGTKMDNTYGVNVLGLSYTPAETIEVVSRAGTHRGMMRPDKIFFAGVYGGILLSFGAAASLIVNAEPWYAENAPGFPRLVGALIFPVGLVLIVLTGAELFTAGNMVGYYYRALLGTTR